MLDAYRTSWSPTRCGWLGRLFRGREGTYVALRLLVLLGLLATVSGGASVLVAAFIVAVALFLLIDTILVNVTVALVTERPDNLLRSVVLALLSFASVAVAFAVFHSLMRNRYDPPLATGFQALYFSVVTVTTLGFGDITPTDNWSRALVMCELGIAVLFVVVLVARVAGWKRDGV